MSGSSSWSESTAEERPWGLHLAQLALLTVGIAAAINSRSLGWWLPQGPGAGFFPLVLSTALVLLSVTWFLQSLTIRHPRVRGLSPDARRIIATVLGLAVLAGVMNLFGFQLSMFVFLLLELKVIGRARWLTAVLTALAGSFGAFYLFNNFLGVPLPTSILVVLANLGL